MLLATVLSGAQPVALHSAEIILLDDSVPRTFGSPDPVTGLVETVNAGDRLPVVDWGRWIRSPSGGAIRFVTVLSESGTLARLRHDEVAHVVHQVTRDEFGVHPDTGRPFGWSRLEVALQDRQISRHQYEFFDRKVVLIPSFESREVETRYYEGGHSFRSAVVEYLDLQRASELVLSVEFAGGSGVSATTPFNVTTEDFVGDGVKELVIEAQATTIAAGAVYANSSIETYVFTYDGVEPSPLVRFVDLTEAGGRTIEYTHVVERDSSGTVEELHQYAVQREGGGRHRVDKSVRRYRDDEFEWILERNRMTRIIPNERRSELRAGPHNESRVRDWLMRPEPVQPVDVETDEDGAVWLKIDQPRGASGWIRNSDVQWRPHRP